MKHFDLFSGYGGFSLALKRVYESNNRKLLPSETTENIQQDYSNFKKRQNGVIGCGFETIGFSEIDKYASAVLKYHWPNTKNYGDITKINWAEVPDFDLLTGGSPCQDLSIAGKRAGLGGKRSGLFYEFMRAVKEKKPKYFIWENVKGALSSNNGRDFGAVVNEMAEAGYSLWWQVLNAKDFGVPQNRERIFVVGFRDGSPREVFFERENVSISNISNKSKETQPQTKYACTIRTKEGTRSDDNFVSKENKIRRLTPTECERLMGLPDGWTAKGIMDNNKDKIKDDTVQISDSQRYKLCGNGVVVNVVEEILKEIVLHENKD